VSLGYPRKLIRDRVPEAIRANGQEPIITAPVDDVDVLELLLTKLQEEVDELEEAAWCTPRSLAAEMADLLEVMRALAEFFDLDWQTIEQEREEKRADLGGFTRRLVWHGNREGTA
jgi:predicted house-cleaning noncanonical NTP pyrophosphatase (MazG superfamily)